MKLITLGEDEPYAFFVKGHVPFKPFAKLVNRGWSSPIVERENPPFYLYAKQFKNGSYKVNVSPNTKDAFPVTIAFFEPGYGPPEQ